MRYKFNKLLIVVVGVEISSTQLQIYSTSIADFMVENTLENSNTVLRGHIAHFQFSESSHKFS